MSQTLIAKLGSTSEAEDLDKALCKQSMSLQEAISATDLDNDEALARRLQHLDDTGQDYYGKDGTEPELAEDDDEVEGAGSQGKNIPMTAWKESDGSWKSKHDPTLWGRKNCSDLEKYSDMMVGDDVLLSNAVKGNLRQKLKREQLQSTYTKTGKQTSQSRMGRSKTQSREANKADVKTKQSVLDQRTKLLIFKLMNRSLIEQMYGCIRTGKESSVYYAIAGAEMAGLDERPAWLDPQDDDERLLAVKMYRTTLNEFSSRADYVLGDSRYKGGKYKGFVKHSKRKQVEVWVEKEYRNLVRMQRCCVPSPKPLHYEEHVLVMELIDSGQEPATTLSGAAESQLRAAPQLKEAGKHRSKKLYMRLLRQAVAIIRKLWCDCKLVHILTLHTHTAYCH
jgi:serine/threonine-protein kinase RIO1